MIIIYRVWRIPFMWISLILSYLKVHNLYRLREWLLFNAKWAPPPISCRKSVTFDGIIILMIFALFYANTLSWIFIVLAHWNNDPWVDMSLHSDTLTWFRVNQYLLFLLSTARLTEKQKIPDRCSNPRSTAIDASTLTITLQMCFWLS